MAIKDASSLSGVSVGFGLVALELRFGYCLAGTYDAATKYIAAVLILIGLADFFVELSNRLGAKGLRFDKLGAGLLLLLSALYGAYLACGHLSSVGRGIAVGMIVAVVLIGCMAVADFIVSIFEVLVAAPDKKGKIIGFAKFLAILTSSLATTKQLID